MQAMRRKQMPAAILCHDALSPTSATSHQTDRADADERQCGGLGDTGRIKPAPPLTFERLIEAVMLFETM